MLVKLYSGRIFIWANVNHERILIRIHDFKNLPVNNFYNIKSNSYYVNGLKNV